MMKDGKHHRRLLNLAIEKDFQKWLLVRIFGVIILSSVLAAVILFFYAHHETVNSFYSAHIRIRRVSDLLLPVILCGSCVSLVAGTILAVFLPQKIAGPLYRISRELGAVGDGDLRVVIRLRKDDTLQSFAAHVNEVIAELNGRFAALQDESEKLDAALENCDQAAAAAAARKLRDELGRVRVRS